MESCEWGFVETPDSIVVFPAWCWDWYTRPFIWMWRGSSSVHSNILRRWGCMRQGTGEVGGVGVTFSLWEGAFLGLLPILCFSRVLGTPMKSIAGWSTNVCGPLGSVTPNSSKQICRCASPNLSFRSLVKYELIILLCLCCFVCPARCGVAQTVSRLLNALVITVSEGHTVLCLDGLSGFAVS